MYNPLTGATGNQHVPWRSFSSLTSARLLSVTHLGPSRKSVGVHAYMSVRILAIATSLIFKDIPFSNSSSPQKCQTRSLAQANGDLPPITFFLRSWLVPCVSSRPVKGEASWSCTTSTTTQELKRLSQLHFFNKIGDFHPQKESRCRCQARHQNRDPDIAVHGTLRPNAISNLVIRLD